MASVTMDGPPDRQVAKASWARVQTVRSDILAKLNALKKERGNVNYTARFEEIEATLAEFRLACVQLIFHDFEYAAKKTVEHHLWWAHVHLNGEYRRTLGRLNTQAHIVQKRKLDKQYRTFLKTSESFYVVYVQRLSQCYPIPELQQIALGGEARTGSGVKNIPPSEPLRKLVTAAYQTTLLHLGDLVRYKCQAVDKFSQTTFAKASDYYALANTLDPDDGSAHHQLGVLHQSQDQHIDTMYHFYRAIAVAKPHELALGNLERAFKKSLENTSQAKRGPNKDPSEAMVTWFVRLHAYFFHGKQFSQHSELEEEVLHRVEIALKSEGTEVLLLKMILTNIAAYYVASQKVKTSWTMEGSQSCQFSLRFNVRMLLAVVRAFDKILRSETAGISKLDEVPTDGESWLTFDASFMRLVPILRLYLAWVYVSQADLVQYREYLAPHINELYKMLAEVLTCLNVYIDAARSTITSQYLLAEDVEAQGLRPIDDERLPHFMNVADPRDLASPQECKQRKRQRSIGGRQFKQETEMVWRIRDLIYCGILLAGSAPVPIALTVQTHVDRTIETWVFTDELDDPITSDEAGMSQLVDRLNFKDFRVETDKQTERQMPQGHAQGISSNGLPEILEGSKQHVSKSTIETCVTPAPTRPIINHQYSNFLEQDSEMVNMVNKLLDPVDDERPRSSQIHDESSYGMHSSTANEIFNNLDVNHPQSSPVAKALPSLPWNYFYRPTPHQANQPPENGLGLAANNYHTSRSTASPSHELSSSPYLNGLAAPFSRSPRPGVGYMESSMATGAPGPRPSSQNHESGTLEGSRSAVLDSLTSALFAQHGLARSNAPSAPMHASMSPAWDPQAAHGTPDLPSAQPARSHQARPSLSKSTLIHPERQPIGPPSSAKSVASPALRTASNGFAAARSSVNHNFDVQHLWPPQGTSSDQQAPRSPWQYSALPVGSTFAFSNTSSLLAGTPRPADNHSVTCNGKAFNASTPYGRLGGGVNNREDPTHFRNQLKAATGSDQMIYDQAILQAAMIDSNGKPRPKYM
ncbi:hypothetical protein GGR57DRAFT_12639 [Xylariaceae sp. FL1272]|nr:hypothetical protein GGR57DRAFT_12639 [Xylariaceae sp. FL1272]